MLQVLLNLKSLLSVNKIEFVGHWHHIEETAVKSQRDTTYSPRFAWGGRPHRRFISVRERG